MSLPLVAAAVIASFTPEVAAPPKPPPPSTQLADARSTALNEAKWAAKKAIDELRIEAGCELLAFNLTTPFARKKEDHLVKQLREELTYCRTLQRTHPAAVAGDLKATQTFGGVARRYGKRVRQEAIKLLMANDPGVAARASRLFPLKASFTAKDASAFDSDAIMLNLQDGLKEDVVTWGVTPGELPSALNAELVITEVKPTSRVFSGTAMKPWIISVKGTWTEAGGETFIPLDGDLRFIALNRQRALSNRQVHERFMEAWVAYELSKAAGDPQPMLRPTKKIPKMPALGRRRRR